MKIEFDTSFGRDVKKLTDSVLKEINEIIEVIEEATSLNGISYSIKKIEGYRKGKAFRLKLSVNSDYRLGFYLDGDTVVLSRLLHRKEIYKFFPPKR